MTLRARLYCAVVVTDYKKLILFYPVPRADTGASDAADWAIARSLKSLKKAEEGAGSSGGGSHKGGSHQPGADDDESV